MIVGITNLLFNVYYLNFSKVYEIKMMLSNVIKTDESVETDQGDKKETSLFPAPVPAKPYLR